MTLSFDELDSTNDLALRWIAKNKPIAGTVITAAFQRNGKGQIGRKWEGSPRNNLAYTVILFPPDLSSAHTFYALMALSTGIQKAVSGFSGLEGIELKWPNDLYLQEKKLGGMLIQTALSGQKVQHLVFGVGINVNEAKFSSELQHPVSLYQITGEKYELNDLVRTINENLELAYQKVIRHKWTEIHNEYHERMLGRGEERRFVELRINRSFTGIVKSVTPEGKLHLEEDGEDKYYLMHELKWI